MADLRKQNAVLRQQLQQLQETGSSLQRSALVSFSIPIGIGWQGGQGLVGSAAPVMGQTIRGMNDSISPVPVVCVPRQPVLPVELDLEKRVNELKAAVTELQADVEKKVSWRSIGEIGDDLFGQNTKIDRLKSVFHTAINEYRAAWYNTPPHRHRRTAIPPHCPVSGVLIKLC